LKFLENSCRIHLFRLEIKTDNHLSTLEKINWDKPFKLSELVKKIFQNSNKNINSDFFIDNIIEIFNSFEKEKKIFKKYSETHLIKKTTSLFIQIQMNGNISSLKCNTEIFLKKGSNFFTLFKSFFFKEKFRDFLRNKTSRIINDNINNLIKIIKQNGPPKTSVFIILNVRKITVYRKKKIKDEEKKRNLIKIFS
jgi:hypothetical protein